MVINSDKPKSMYNYALFAFILTGLMICCGPLAIEEVGSAVGAICGCLLC